jgi:hypothetical protein
MNILKFVLKYFGKPLTTPISICYALDREKTMHTLIYTILGEKHTIEQENLKDLLSVCIDVFNQNGQLLEIQRDGKTLYESCDIYKLIKRAVY